MIRVKVYLNSGNYEYLTYVCNETEEEYMEAVAKSGIAILTDAESGALITIPTDKYATEVWPYIAEDSKDSIHVSRENPEE